MRKFLFVPLFLTMIGASCGGALQDIAEGLNKAAVSVGEVQTIVIAAWENDVITKAESDGYIAGGTVPVLTAIGHANGAVAVLAARPEVERDELLEIIPPVIAALNDALSDEKLGIITNEGTKAAVSLGLNGIITALSVLQATTGEE